MSSEIHKLNPGDKKWKLYAHNIIAREGTDDLILEVSANKQIIFKKGTESYTLADLSNTNNLINGSDASFQHVDLTGNLKVDSKITYGTLNDGTTNLTTTIAELNILDGGTSATSTTVADADRVVLNDGGIMKQVAVTDLAAYFDDEITAMPNLVTTAATTVGALNSGSITSGFGSINNGSSAITTTGTITYGTLNDGTTNLTTTIAELNILDGGTSATSTTVADADRVVLNDGGIMKQVAVTDLAAYFDDEITAMPNLVTTAATTVGALNSGSITSGFGTINTGSSAITTTGAITGGSFVIGSASISEEELETIDGITKGTAAASKALVVDSNVDIAGLRNLSTTGTGVFAGGINTTNVTVGAGKTLDVQSGTFTTSAAQKLAILEGAGADVDIGGYNLRAQTLTADGLTSGRLVFAGTNGLLSDDSDLTFSTDTLTATKIGAFEAAGAINFANQAMTNVDINSGAIDGTVIGANSAAAATFSQINLYHANGNSTITKDTNTITIDPYPAGGDISGTVVIKGDLIVDGTTTRINSTTVDISDRILTLNSNQTGTPSLNAGLEIERGSEPNKTFIWDETSNRWTLGSETLVAGTIIANITGNIDGDITGNAATATVLQNARTIGGVSFNGGSNIDLPGVNTTGDQDTTGNAATATLATTITATANNSTNETVYLTFVDGATGSQGIETDTGLNYNPSTGLLTTTSVAANLTGNVTGNVSGTAATVTGAAQTNITSLGTLTALQVDNLNVNGNTITASSGALNLTPASGSAIVLDGTINVDAGEVTGATSITSTAFVGDLTGDVTGNVSGTAATVTGAAQTNITSLGTLTALQVDNLNVNGNTITASSGALNLTPAAGSAIVLDGTINVDAGELTGATSITSTAFVGDLTGDVTGNVSGTAATVTGAAQTNITSLGTLTALQVDNLNVNGNTITASSGALNLTPAAGSAIVLDGTINVDAGEVTGATSITSTAFVGNLTGDVTGNVSGNSGTTTTLSALKTSGLDNDLSGTSTSWTDATGYVLAHTLQSQHSYVKLDFKVNYISSPAANQTLSFRVLRSTDGGSSYNATPVFTDSYLGSTFGVTVRNVYNGTFVDTPNATNLAYKLQFKRESSTTINTEYGPQNGGNYIFLEEKYRASA